MKFNKEAAKKSAINWLSTGGAVMAGIVVLGTIETLFTGKSRLWRSGILEGVVKASAMTAGAGYVLSGCIEATPEGESNNEWKAIEPQIAVAIKGITVFLNSSVENAKEKLQDAIVKFDLSDVIDLEKPGYGIEDYVKAKYATNGEKVVQKIHTAVDIISSLFTPEKD